MGTLSPPLASTFSKWIIEPASFRRWKVSSVWIHDSGLLVVRPVKTYWRASAALAHMTWLDRTSPWGT